MFLGPMSKSTEQSIAILFSLERRCQILHSVLPGRSCFLTAPVSLIAVVHLMLENFVQGACLAFVRYILFVIPLSISELFIREAAALPS